MSEMHYEVVANIAGSEVFDVNYLSFVRAAIHKQSSFTLFKANIKVLHIKQVTDQLTQNKFPPVNIKIYSCDEVESDKRLQLLYDQTLLCVYCSPISHIDYSTTEVPVEFMLVHPVLHYMETTLTFNKILKNKKGMEALLEYENHIKTSYGDIFDFKKVGDNTEKNEFMYNQLLIGAHICKNDLNVPNYLLYGYKINNTFCFYFFDNFYLSSSTKKEITAHYINTYDKKLFEQVDSKKYVDSSHLIKRLGDRPITDHSKLIDKEEDGTNVFIHNGRQINYKHEKKTSSPIMSKDSGSTESTQLTEGRSSNTTTDGNLTLKNVPQSTKFTRIYTPDDVENAESRFKLAKELIKTKIDGTSIIEISQSLPDFPQFGKIYNLGLDTPNYYLYTPINIVNIFARKNFREHYLYHMSKCVFLKYQEEPVK